MTTEPKLLTEADVRLLLEYDPSTGALLWRKRPASMFEGKSRPAAVLAAIWNTRQAGRAAGSPDGEGYLSISLLDRKYLAHRIAWTIHYGEWPTGHIDHINHDRLDNRISNLRCVSLSQNNKNRTKQRNNSSGHTGIRWEPDRKVWLARISCGNRRTINLGRFSTLEQAIEARESAARQLGFHENHGKHAALTEALQ